MLLFWEGNDKYLGKPQSYDPLRNPRDLRLCIRLLKLYSERPSDWVFTLPKFNGTFEAASWDDHGKPLTWKFNLKPADNPDDYKINRHVNIKNASRFCPKALVEGLQNPKNQSLYCSYLDELYFRKVIHLYHLIRYYKEDTWND